MLGDRSVFCAPRPLSDVITLTTYRTDGGGGRTRLLLTLSHLTLDHASLSRRSTVPTPNRDTANIWALITFFSICYIETFLLFRRPWPPSTSRRVLYTKRRTHVTRGMGERGRIHSARSLLLLLTLLLWHTHAISTMLEISTAGRSTSIPTGCGTVENNAPSSGA